MIIFFKKSKTNKNLANLCDSEGIPCSSGLYVSSLEPTLVTSLNLEDKEITLGDGGSKEVMATTFVTIRSTGNNLVLVVLLTVLVSSFLDVEDGSSRDSAGSETSLRARIALVEGSLLTEKVGIVLEELVGGAKAVNRVLAYLLLQDNEVVDGIEVILIAEDGSGEILLLGGVPLGREEESETLTGIGSKACKSFKNSRSQYMK